MIKKNKIKICYIILNGESYGGSEKHVVDLMNCVCDKNYEKFLIYSKGNKLIETIKPSQSNFCLGIERNIISIKQVLQILIKEKPDIVHVHAARAIFIGRLVTYICRKIFKVNFKLIVTSHGLWLPEKKNNKIYKFFMHFLKHQDNITIAVSKKSKNELIDCGYDPKKLLTIYNGIDFKEFNEYRMIKNSIQKVGFIGRFTDQKGVKILLEAMSIDENKYEFKIFGEGELEKYIKEYIENNKLRNVSYCGYCSNVGEALKEIDLLVAPSIDEGLPYTLIEAINCGLPIIATDVGGIPEIVYNKQNGLIIEKNSVVSLTNSLNSIKRMNITSLSKKSILISEKFSIEVMIEDIESVYANIMKVGGSIVEEKKYRFNNV